MNGFDLRKLPPPDSRCNYGVTPPHGSRLEDVRNLRIDGWIVAGTWTEGTVPKCIIVRVCINTNSTIFARQELRQPFVVYNVLIGSNGKLASTVEKPLVFFR